MAEINSESRARRHFPGNVKQSGNETISNEPAGHIRTDFPLFVASTTPCATAQNEPGLKR